MIAIDQLSKVYYQGKSAITALDNISCQINAGERVAIVGPSGSGKTTLLSLMAGLEQPSQGRITINQTTLQGLSEQALSAFRAQHLGIVFQQFHLMQHLSALENVCLALDILGKPNSNKTASALLEQVGLGHRLHHFPHQLSGGECQRVAIARACAPQPHYLFADEPSGSLDAQTGERIMQLLFELSAQQEMTLVLITHNRGLAEQCDRTLTIAGGTLL